MKNNYLLTAIILTALVFCSNVMAQVTNEGLPESWSLNNKNNTVPINMPSLDMIAITGEDAISDLDKSNPYRFGYEMDVNLGLINAGVWDNLPNGDRVWRINIVSQGANTLNFIFDSYKLPEGATVYLYSDDHQSLIGAYTSTMNHPEETLGTWLVDGDNIWIEYYEPANVYGQGKLNIGGVIHGYRSVTEASLANRGLNDSGACNLDVDCTIGSDFDAKKDLLKHSVGLVLQGGSLCTGTLLNNTSLDKEPYFIFANHCNFNPATTSFRFNWISPSPVCAANGNSGSSAFNTTSGAQFLATASQSDYRLFRITGGIDDAWDLEWAGWDATDIVPDYTIGIHHPAGDIMKVCRNDTGLSQQTSGGQIFWGITSAGGGWEQGVTEGGSSGSGLFNPDGQLIGTLCCGAAACAGTNDNGQVDFYGRFATSYNNGNLAQWLDPTNSGVTSLNTLSDEVLGLDANTLGSNITIYPNPSSGIVNIAVSDASSTDLEYTVNTIDGRNIASGNFNNSAALSFESQSNGIYFITIKNVTTNSSITKKVIIRK